MNSIIKRMRDFYYRFRPLEDYYGPEFKRYFRFLRESRNFGRDQIRERKLSDLRQLVAHAGQNVPYYRELFKQLDINSEDIKTFEDFARLPILTKDDVRGNFERLKADNFQSYHAVIASTSGTSGQNTSIYRSRSHENFRKAVLWRFYSENGIDPGDKRLTVTTPGGYSPNIPLYNYDRVENKLNLNIYHIFQRNIAPLYEVIRKFAPKMIWAHPTSFAVLAEYGLENGLEPIPVPVVATYAESIEAPMKAILQKMFPGKYIEYYGNRENTIAAWGFSDGNFFEVSEYCHIEVDSSEPEGDVISTALRNYAFPLIRYQTGDYIRMLGDVDAQVPYPKFELIGARGKNLLISKQGITCPYIITNLVKNGMNILKRYQVEQIDLDNIVLRIIPLDSYNRERDEARMLELVDQALVGLFKVKLEYVENIEFTRAGKFQTVVSPLAEQYLKQASQKAI